ncbi:MAG TPA: hypothetical protein VGQ40_04665, partial [Chthoniobacterales bacterium]|nr:hypothetical protein [Chthoniobacterales bacterium]
RRLISSISYQAKIACMKSFIPERPNQTMELTATRCASTFRVLKMLPLRLTPGLGDRSSSCSR